RHGASPGACGPTRFPPQPNDGRNCVDEQELRRRYYERLSAWTDTGVVKINRNGKLLESLAELRKRIFKLPWNRPKR
ncbi:MAG: hypothetical protein K0S99_1862, partial [Thermomicrobiales bacterium]|nr:hypothetical protein [Thermomicrobiales bacterium]